MAAGRRARAVHAGTFVWADNHDASVQSVRTNEFVVRAENGLRLTDTAGAAEAIDKGVYFRDNAIVAWAKVNATGVAYGHDFGISNITRNSAGNYWIVVDADAAVADNLIAVATVEVESPPISAATARLIYVTQNGINNFYVHITNGSHVATDNDFMIMVTAR